ncbi:MAG: hypothetical protein AMXMBFR33_61850 [Candidatus Xenobia bacterium]
MSRILLLEDDPDLRSVLQGVLEDEGFSVHIASRGEEAVHHASGAAFDLIVADIRMEGMDGLDALAHVQKQTPGIGSIVITGYSSEADSVRAVKLGVGDYLRKPFMAEEFLESVHRVLADVRQKRQHSTRESELIKALLTAVESLARTLKTRDPLEAADLAARICAHLGVPTEEATAVRMATLIAAAQRAGGEELMQGLLPSLPETVRNLVEDLDGLDEGSRLEAQIAAVAIEAIELGPIAGVALSRALESRNSGRFEPRLLEVLDAVDAPAEQECTAGRRQALLSLARALEAAGDPRNAALALASPLLTERPSWEGVQALLTRARLHRMVELADQAAEQARLLGSSPYASTCVEAALLTGNASYARRACELFAQLRFPAQEARARLAAAVLAGVRDDEALGPLLSPENQEVLMRCTPWCLPALRAWRQAGSTPAERALQRFGRDVEHQQPPILRMYSLGAFEVYRGEDIVDEKSWRSQKVRYLFALLASQPGRRFVVDQLVEDFWPENVERGRKNLSQATSILRKCLRPPSWNGEFDYLSRQGEFLQFDRQWPYWHDLEELERALSEAPRLESAGQSESALEQLGRILPLLRGTYLEGCYHQWALDYRVGLEQRLIAVLRQLGLLALQHERLQQSQDCASAILRYDPCCQDGHTLSMKVYLAEGRAEMAVRQYELARKLLRRELGMEPSIVLEELRQRALLNL